MDMKKITTFIAITSFIALMSGDGVCSQGNLVERQMENGAKVMSPSRIKIDKERSESVKESIAPAPTTDEQIRRINEDFETSMLETQPGDVKPDLKKKKSGAEGGALIKTNDKNFTTITIPANNVIVEQALSEIAETHGIEQGAIKYDGLTNGNVVFTWEIPKAEGGASLKGLIFDKTGAVLKDFTLASGQGSDNDYYMVKAAANGGFIIGHETYNTFNSLSESAKTNFSIFSPSGELDRQIPLYVTVEGYTDNLKKNELSTDYYLSSITTLSDGRFAAVWESWNGPGSFKVFDPAEFKESNPEKAITVNESLFFTNTGDAQRHTKLATLPNDKIAIVATGGGYTDADWNWIESNCGFAVFDPDKTDNSLQFVNALDSAVNDPKISVLSDGGFIISAWTENEGNNAAINIARFDYVSDGTLKKTEISPISFGNASWYYGKLDIIELSDGGFAAIFGAPGEKGYFIQIFDRYGSAVGREGINGTETVYDYEDIHVSRLENDTFGFSRYDPETMSWQYNQYDTDGNILTGEDIMGMEPRVERVNSDKSAQKALLSDTDYPDRWGPRENDLLFTVSLDSDYGKPLLDTDAISAIFKGVLNADKAGMLGAEKAPGGEINPAFLAKLVAESLREFALAVPMAEITPQQMKIAMIIASMLRDPTPAQKIMIDALTSLFEEAKEGKGDGTSDSELSEASDEFTRMVTVALLAQALPGLLKEGDIENMKGIFSELDTEKSRLLREYRQHMKGYYTSMLKELAANMAALQIKGLLRKNITETELAKLPPSKIDEIIKNIRNVKDKTITEEQILKKEIVYRKRYLEPAKKTFEKNMTALIRGFTRAILDVLDGAGLVKEDTEQKKPYLNIDLSAK